MATTTRSMPKSNQETVAALVVITISALSLVHAWSEASSPSVPTTRAERRLAAPARSARRANEKPVAAIPTRSA